MSLLVVFIKILQEMTCIFQWALGWQLIAEHKWELPLAKRKINSRKQQSTSLSQE